MKNLRKILVAYDGSPDSRASLDIAIHLANRTGASLNIVKVFETDVGASLWADGPNITRILEIFEAEKENGRKLVELACERCRSLGIEAQSTLLAGPVAASLLRHVQEYNIDLIVAGNKGQGIFREAMTGSTTSSLVELSPVPVLVVKEKNRVGKLKKLLLGYDGSDSSKKALNWAMDFCKATGAELKAVTVSDPSSLAMIYVMSGAESAESFSRKIAAWVEEEKKLLSEIDDFGKKSGVNVAVEALQGNTVDAIIKYGQQADADLLVVGSKGRSAVAALLLGSVARGLLHLSTVPVLVVK